MTQHLLQGIDDLSEGSRKIPVLDGQIDSGTLRSGRGHSDRWLIFGGGDQKGEVVRGIFVNP